MQFPSTAHLPSPITRVIPDCTSHWSIDVEPVLAVAEFPGQILQDEPSFVLLYSPTSQFSQLAELSAWSAQPLPAAQLEEHATHPTESEYEVQLSPSKHCQPDEDEGSAPAVVDKTPAIVDPQPADQINQRSYAEW